MQNKVMRFVLGQVSRYHICHKDFRSLNWLPISLRVKQLQLNHMFKVRHKLAPQYLVNDFTLIKDVHTIETRASVESFFVPRCNTYGQKSFMYNGILAWNSLPVRMRKVNDLF